MLLNICYDMFVHVCIYGLLLFTYFISRSKNLLCKKASISLGIRFDDSKYGELKKHLKTIGKAKELVSYDFAIERSILNNNISKGNHIILTCNKLLLITLMH